MEYRVSRADVGGRACIEHRHNSQDTKLFGRNGYIWQCPNGRYAAVITSSRLINRSFPTPDFKHEAGREKLVYFDARELRDMVRSLRIPRDPAEQVKLAEAFETMKNASADV